MNILLIYGTTEGQTRKISEFIKPELEKQWHVVSLCDATNHPLAPDGFDAVIIASSVHAGKYQAAVKHYIQKYHAQLNKMHSAFISVSLTAAGDDAEEHKELQDITDKFLAACSWKPCLIEYTAGALLFTEYDYFKKVIMRMIAKREGHPATGDTEYTDWSKLRAFLKKFIAQWTPVPQNVSPIESDQEAVA
jgi:menaquinone-dependent protoporphyrinogen oxidase